MGGGANHKSHPMTSAKIFERGTFCATKILENGRPEAVACAWHITGILLYGEGLNPLKKRKCGNG